MIKLRTLNEIETETGREIGFERCNDFIKIFHNKLKAEAIKWWKSFNCGKDVCCTCEEMWRDFFDLGDELAGEKLK